MILALDISTSITGWALIDPETSEMRHGSIDLRKTKGFVAKVNKAKNEIIQQVLPGSPSVVVVEKNLQSFRRGFSSAATINTLARMNGALSYATSSFFDVELVEMEVSKIRKTLDIKTKRKKDNKKSKKPTKELVREGLEAYLESIGHRYCWETKVLKSGPRKGTEILADGVYDEIDALAAGLAYLKNQQGSD